MVASKVADDWQYTSAAIWPFLACLQQLEQQRKIIGVLCNSALQLLLQCGKFTRHCKDP
jgi:hypothetical protein